MRSTPYISLIIAGRNDNYGGDFELRLQNCIRWTAFYVNKFRLQTEFIIVNYNPLSERKQLSETIQFPFSEFVTYRIITVPVAFHIKITDESPRQKVPLYEYVAKNIGIRRAKGSFILAANPDILVDPSIWKAISAQQLALNTYYRVNRADYSGKLKSIEPSSDLKRVRQSTFRIFMRGYMYPLKMGLSLPKMLWLYAKNFIKLRYNLTLVNYEDFANKHTIPVTYDNISLKIHANCSGDFMLMHKQQWFGLKAYPEKTKLSIHTDALMVATAKFSGLKEKVFFWPVYHQDHERRFVADNLNADIHAMFRKFEDDGKWMEQNKKAIIYNDDNWGYPDENFEDLAIKT